MRASLVLAFSFGRGNERCVYCWKMKLGKKLKNLCPSPSWGLIENNLESVNATRLRGTGHGKVFQAFSRVPERIWNLDKRPSCLSSAGCTHSERALKKDPILLRSPSLSPSLYPSIHPSFPPGELMHSLPRCEGRILPPDSNNTHKHESRHKKS